MRTFAGGITAPGSFLTHRTYPSILLLLPWKYWGITDWELHLGPRWSSLIIRKLWKILYVLSINIHIFWNHLGQIQTYPLHHDTIVEWNFIQWWKPHTPISASHRGMEKMLARRHSPRKPRCKFSSHCVNWTGCNLGVTASLQAPRRLVFG